jgi:hypothetical protein
MRRLDLPTLRAALWALRASGRARRAFARKGLHTPSLPAVPNVGLDAERGVTAVLHRRGHTCLVQASVRQQWLAAHGDRRDLIIGVRGPGDEFGAHAWLEGDHPCHSEGFHELVRRAAA